MNEPKSFAFRLGRCRCVTQNQPDGEIKEKIMRIYQIIKWLWQGAPMIYYEGYHCGCCGNWVNKPFIISTLQSQGKWWDGWGLCPKGEGCNKEEEGEP